MSSHFLTHYLSHLTRQLQYSATLARFFSRDPVAEAGGINLYAYVQNNPVYFTDSSGLGPLDGLEPKWPQAPDSIHWTCPLGCVGLPKNIGNEQWCYKAFLPTNPGVAYIYFRTQNGDVWVYSPPPRDSEGNPTGDPCTWHCANPSHPPESNTGQPPSRPGTRPGSKKTESPQ